MDLERSARKKMSQFLTRTPLSTTSCQVMYPVPVSLFLPAVDTMSSNLEKKAFSYVWSQWDSMTNEFLHERNIGSIDTEEDSHSLFLVKAEQISYIWEIIATNEVHQMRIRRPRNLKCEYAWQQWETQVTNSTLHDSSFARERLEGFF